MEIWRFDLNTRRREQLTNHQARDYNPVYSPCGKFIAFVSHREGFDEQRYVQVLRDIRAAAELGDFREVDKGIKLAIAMEPDSDLHIMNADGTGVRQLTKGAGSDVGPCFSPCGKYIAYASSVGGNTHQERIRIIDATNGKQIDFHYSRENMMREVAAHPAGLTNKSLLARLLPDFIERRLIEPSFFGEERQPNWTK
jgi:Tol biopolymer transport system component